jgi:hypothetical protein
MATKRKASKQACIPPRNKRVRANSRVPEPLSDDDMSRKKGTSRVRACRHEMAPSPSPSPLRRSPHPSAPGGEELTAEYEHQSKEEVSADVTGETECRTPSSKEVSSKGDDHEADDDDPLLTRVRTGITYTRTQHYKSHPVMQTTCFEILLPTDDYSPSPSQAAALILLSAAYKSEHATLIRNSPVTRVYELGVPVPYLVAESVDGVPIHSPHWWVGESAAEIKATKRKKAEKDGKTKREREIEDQLEEALRRQEAGLKMWDSGTDSSGGSASGSSTYSGDSSGSGSEGDNKQLSDILEEEEDDINLLEQWGAKGIVVQGPYGDSDSDRLLLPRMVRRSSRAEKKAHHQPTTATETTAGSDNDTFLQPQVIRRSPRPKKTVQLRRPVDDSDSDAPLVLRRRSQRKH